ncbi:endolytic transglycosylase MltG [Candidatus Blastococcus massiliensis]|uniref:endolytic transglycosylase MltG n=1 Tax=Candidatus Blastococcus massiliensis TaxID=1470358 RepID=UPI0004BC4C16|nr:endolytic transglycosylase MltG [Candidatus Blastococcus massiliensis]
MSEPGGPGRRGRHSSGEGAGGFSTPSWGAGFPPAPGFADAATGGIRPGDPRHGENRPRFEPWADAGASTGGFRHVSGVLNRHEDRTGPLPEPAWWSYASSDHPDHPRARHADGDDGPGSSPQHGGPHRPDSEHPSAPLPPLPPRPAGVWDRLQPRTTGPADDDDATVAQHVDLDGYDPRDVDASSSAEEDDEWEDRTGGLEVIGSHVEEDAPRRRRGLRRRSEAGRGTPGRRSPQDGSPQDGAPHDHPDERIPVAPYDRRDDPSRRKRRPWAVLLSLLVIGGLVVGIVLGVQALMGLMTAEDYTGEGTGTVEIRVSEGDTLTDIARTLAEADVIASTGPFVDAAEDRPEATGIQPGRYGLRQQMSGAAALDLLLSNESRLLSRVTIPEGLTVARTLERLATETGRPIEEFEAAAADIPALGLPAYANGQLEGYLFPATYDVDPEDTPAQLLRSMVQQFTTVATGLQLEQRAAAVGRTPAEIVTVASMIQSETRLDSERPDVAQVIYNRLGQGIPLGIDATLAFALSKSGNDLTVTDLRTDGPYNTRTRTGLPPTPISSPGEASLEAALTPSSGNLLYYVLESADGTHFFTADYAEFQAARQRCAAAGLGCGG